MNTEKFETEKTALAALVSEWFVKQGILEPGESITGVNVSVSRHPNISVSLVDGDDESPQLHLSHEQLDEACANTVEDFLRGRGRHMLSYFITVGFLARQTKDDIADTPKVGWETACSIERQLWAIGLKFGLESLPGPKEKAVLMETHPSFLGLCSLFDSDELSVYPNILSLTQAQETVVLEQLTKAREKAKYKGMYKPEEALNECREKLSLFGLSFAS